MNSQILVANWKMNFTSEQTVEFLNKILNRTDLMQGIRIEYFGEAEKGTRLIICPPFTSLASAYSLISCTSIKLGAQTLNHYNDGPYTGEVSPQMIAEFCDYVILGHSERRLLFKETSHDVNLKALAAIDESLQPIICIDGQSDADRESKHRILNIGELAVQVRDVIKDIPKESKFIVAYEPTWAIGSGEAANPDEVNKITSTIREIIANEMGNQTRMSVPILYGGSITLDNINDYCELPEVNGVLVGGASLDPEKLILLANTLEGPL